MISNKEMYYIQNPDDKDNIQWVVDLMEKYYKPMNTSFNIDGQSIYHSRDLNNLGDIKADRDILICDICNSCWEDGKTPGERDYYIYKNFPRLGKKNKKTCPECQK